MFLSGDSLPRVTVGDSGQSDGSHTVVVSDGAGHVRIRREARRPFSRHLFTRDGQVGWTLSTSPILRHRHTLVLESGAHWFLRTPFFSTRVSGTSRGGLRLAGQVQRATEWHFALPHGCDAADFLAALGFLHRQWYLYS